MKKIDTFRKFHLAMAEAIDAWRLAPRILVAAYGWMLYEVVRWYMNLTPYILDGCTSKVVTDCLVQAPTTQHAALVTAVVGISAAIFGLYSSSGRKWDKKVENWEEKEKDPENSLPPSQDES